VCYTVEDRKLFIGMIPKSFAESDVAELFSPFGTIEDCSVLKEATGNSKGMHAFYLILCYLSLSVGSSSKMLLFAKLQTLKFGTQLR